MKLLFASDSFKGTLTSKEISDLLALAANEVFGKCECICIPVADGGEGTVDAVVTAMSGEIVSAETHNPLMNLIESKYGIFDENKAIIEMSAASGLVLVPQDKRDPCNSSSYGTGELILDALDRGCRDITIALGGSATNDGGMGCLNALGVRFYNSENELLHGYGRDLNEVRHIDADNIDPRIRESSITVLCDVKNPLCGDNGATMTFGMQKGADPDTLKKLETGMCRYRDVINRDFGIDCDAIEGSGAAGGMGAALAVFCGGRIRSGINTILDLIGFDSMLPGTDLVVTGEGRVDWQSCYGKVLSGVGERCKAHNIPAYALCGSMGKGASEICKHGISGIFTLVSDTVSLEDAIENAPDHYYQAALKMFSGIKKEHDKIGC